MLDSVTHPGSYIGIFVFLVLTGCGMPIPEEVALILAGVLSSQGKLETEWAYAACLSGALVGDLVMYSIGYHFGHNLLILHPKIAKLLHAEREAKYEDSLARHAFKALLLSRFLVGVRGPVYLAAGIVRMPVRKFFLCDLVAATLVVSLFFGLSYYYGESLAELIRDAEKTFTLVVLLIIAGAGLWFYRCHRQELIETVLEDVGKDDEPKSDPPQAERDQPEAEREAS